MYKLLIKPILFLFPAEKAHNLTTSIFKGLLKIPGIPAIFKAIYGLENAKLERDLFGLKFKNPIGLAAGFDKDGKYFKAMEHLGFGFIEIGTVTPLPQDGNPKPRLFRLPKDKALINRMGFNNEGLDAFVSRIRNNNSSIVIGGNIGKNKVTPNEEATNDYIKCFDKLFEHVDYFVVNVSSPNTPGLRELQNKEPLLALLNSLMERNRAKTKTKPILLKIAPDLTDEQLDDIVEIVQESKIDGLIASNTTISRADLRTEGSVLEDIGAGGLSGKPLQKRSTEVIKYIHQKSNGKIPIIGVGGICSPSDAIEKLNAGASLVQIYSGLVYEGPGLIKKINQAILAES